MTIPRPPARYPGSFAAMPVLPELQGRTLAEISASGVGVAIWCRGCGRETILTPLGLRRRFAGHLAASIEAVIERVRCQTCGGRDAQATGRPLEGAEQDRELILLYARHGGPRRPEG